MASQPLRFGVSMGKEPAGSTWALAARDAESLGFDSMFIADHLVAGLHSPFGASGFALAATERLKVGTLVINNDFRHPVITAREAATLSDLSGGRFELGLGAGHMKSEYDEAGLAFDRAGVRVARMAEAAEISRGLLAGEELRFAGEHYQVNGHRLEVAHATPLLIGGNGDKVLRAAARFADIVGFTGFAPKWDGNGVNISHMSTAGIAERITFVRNHAGERFDALELQVLVQAVVVTDRRAVEADRLAGRYGLPVEVVLETPFLLLGTVEEIAAQISSWHRRLGISYWVSFAERPGSTQALDTMAPVIAALR
jgi:probable F420-dependent oxidoreductase